ncbi:hypothetical protein Glove_126g14 [Diversispora epigaea]|uniref:Protein kinase domain-containing protein n=1 Tax=Diversispora epigaea TaxID=1348612 RepID=A0A397J7R8_9GLOM|nr:hypothetical protein Glove_126g14 [Diversispora epigaea]
MSQTSTFAFLAGSDVDIKSTEFPNANAVQSNIESFDMTLKDTHSSLNQKETKKNERHNFSQYARDIVSKISGDNSTTGQKNKKPLSDELKFGICIFCNVAKSNNDWCTKCERKRIAETIGEWTSNNPKLDEYIRQTQLNPLSVYDYFEWIQFDNIIDQKFVTSGRFGQVYKGTWIDGPRHFAKNASLQNWMRKKNEHVALKTIKVQTKEEGFDKFLSELKAHRSFIDEPVSHLMRCYGITQDPKKPDTYTLVMPWAKGGDLSDYLKKRKYDPDFKIIKRIKMLYGISSGLSRIHNKKMIHQDLHSKNILIDDTDFNSPAISDLAFCNTPEPGYGVWQYVAPERINNKNNKKYTETSDIYSFGIIMCEMMSCEKPFNKFEDDKAICVIVNDLKPECPKWTPKSYVELMLKCLDKDPNTYTLVMPWAKGGDLSDYLKKRKYDPDFKIIKRIKMLYGISSGLSRIHNKKMIHQDLHSKNILIDDTDFNSPAISDLAFCNTPEPGYGVWQYVAPERINNKNNKKYTETSDIYSFGIIMCEMMSCEKPFNKFEDDKAICVIVNDLKPECPKWTPKSYVELMLKCLDKDPSKRPSASKLSSNFNDFIESYYNNENNENNEFVVAENQRKENLMKNQEYPDSQNDFTLESNDLNILDYQYSY